MIFKKSAAELSALRESGKRLAAVMEKLRPQVKPGVATIDLDRLAEELVRKAGSLPAFKGYKGYPATLCVSLNDEIVHGIPGERKLAEGDIVSIDLGVNHNGYFTDAAATYAVGKIDPLLQGLIAATRESLSKGIKFALCGNHLFDISHAIQEYVEANGYSVVRQFVGHGIGKNLHEEPEIPNFGKAHQGPLLEEGMVLAIEPMVNLGGWEALIGDNGWTARTKDGSQSAHFEHTVAITAKGPEILTVYG